MNADANVSFIREQLKTFEAMRKELDRDIDTSRRRLTAIRAESLEIRSQIRALRRTLVSDDRQPAAAAIERRIRLADRIERLEVLERDLGGFLDRLAMLAQAAKDLAARRPEITETLSPADNARISQLEGRFIEQLADYGFASYPVETVTLSRVRYTPEHENVELSYGLSASDLIRSIWAYLIALLEECARGDRPHPGFLLFDEPRQQDAARVSFRSLLRRAAGARSRNQQVIFATSDEEENIKRALEGLPFQYLGFEGRILRRVPR